MPIRSFPNDPMRLLPEKIKGEIEFEHVAFAYVEDSPVFKDVSFHIEPGQMVGVVGPTGGGKSTIVSLIPRFYDPNAGAVKIDGKDVRDYQLLLCAITSATCCRRQSCLKEPCATISRTAGRA